MPDRLPVEDAGPRLALFTLPEAHDLLRLLQLVEAEGDELAEEAGWFARETAARIPPES
ncbi:DUF6417 family protein [Streptomyces sp. NPDC021093]|uniref:DUF6417 family protein n=1 Tax=Streptomyces sp. NPDC021093 TaxID=3365112 RepID=UPI00379FD5EC